MAPQARAAQAPAAARGTRLFAEETGHTVPRAGPTSAIVSRGGGCCPAGGSLPHTTSRCPQCLRGFRRAGSLRRERISADVEKGTKSFLLPPHLSLERSEKLSPELCRQQFLPGEEGLFSNPRAGESPLEPLWTHGRVTEARSRALLLCTRRFRSTSFFSATRYRWLFSILFILWGLGVERDGFH